jgi:ADP-ribose pyrophosphatase
MDEAYEFNELVHRGAKFEFRRVGVTMSDGRVLSRDLVHTLGAAVVLPVLGDGSIVLIRNRRFAVGEELWELCAGMIEPDEDPAVCAARELVEETGYRAGTIETLGRFYTSPGYTDEDMHAFLATDLESGAQELEDYEEIRVEAVEPDRVRRMCLDGTIRDGKTLASLALYWWKKG